MRSREPSPFVVLWALLLPAVMLAPVRGATVAESGIRITEQASRHINSTHRSDLFSSPQIAQNQQVALMINSVQSSTVSGLVGGLTGDSAIVVGGQSLLLKTRNSYFSSYIDKATQYVYEFMQSRGLAVSYHSWTSTQEQVSGRNVIGSITGRVAPNEIVLITAHLDDMPEENPAPGADDNASGCAGVMLAAASLAGQPYERTVRFIFFTGEEQGPLGSQAYAADCKSRNENIVAVFNMDMIGWDGNNDGTVTLHLRRKTNAVGYAQDSAIANVFTQVISTYGIFNLKIKIYADYNINVPGDVDNQAFWNNGYPGVLAIEDDMTEANPNYHQATDTLQNLNLDYLTAFIKASMGTAAHLAVPITATKTYLPLVVK